ncbi:DUF3592 domain-containing protein [Andreprevotia chitinilytica]|uniref:DUF3592 domain-containing protein n=1 Tax=Andreprevotia chitinilytica TaxID=396808 RepID=UPI0014705E67|nr:DUF3592 domain-containing protein [Andreprevotia chitinilytica]
MTALFMLWGLTCYVGAVASAYTAKKWPSVQGTIISSRAVRGCGKGTSYYPAVQYRYVVGGVTYTGSRIAFGNVGCGSEGEAKVIADEYVVNAAVLVYFNSGQPSDASLVVGQVLDDTWLGIVMMSVIFIGSIWFAFRVFVSGQFIGRLK